MNEDQIKGQWKQVRGTFRAHWGRLTDDDFDVADGNIQHLIGRIQERYGIAREEAKERLEAFCQRL